MDPAFNHLVHLRSGASLRSRRNIILCAPTGGRGDAGPVRNLPGGKPHRPVFQTRCDKTAAQLREDVIITGGRVVFLDDRPEVEGKRSELVDAAAQALPGAAAGARLAAE